MKGAQRDFVAHLSLDRQAKRDGAMARAKEARLPPVSKAGDKARAVVSAVCSEMMHPRSASAAASYAPTGFETRQR
jgi:hypothetical protein